MATLVLAACAACAGCEGRGVDTQTLAHHTPKLLQALRCDEKAKIRTERAEDAFYCLTLESGASAVIELIAADDALTLKKISVRFVDPHVSKADGWLPHMAALTYFFEQYVEADAQVFDEVLRQCEGTFSFPGSRREAQHFYTEGSCQSRVDRGPKIVELIIWPVGSREAD